ncbi:MAG: flagellar filament capping protein FliD [Myxococcota bacterium]
MSITIDGIFSGFDTTSLIEAILTGSYQRNTLRESQISENQLTQQRFSEMSGHLSDLSSTISSIRDATNGIESQSYTATYADGFGFTATAGEGAVLGSYDINITSLATSQIDSSVELFAERSLAGVMAQGTLSVTVGGTTTDITIDGTNDSLSGFADAINQVSGMSAYVLDTGDATTPYQLVVQSSDTGVDNTFTLDTSGLSGGTVPTFSSVQTGTDAALTVNGIAVTSATNTISSVPGLTIEATQAGLGSNQVVVGLDQDTFKEQVQTFIDDYNEIITFYEANTVYDTSSNIAGPLTGESTARNILDRLGTLASSDYSSVSGSFTLLAQIGIETQQDGTLSLDSVEFDEAFEDNFEDMVEVLTSDDGPLAAIQTQIDDVYINDDGLLDSRRETLQDQIDRLQEDVDRETLRIESRTETLRAQFTKMEEAFAELQNTGTQLSALFAAPASSSST